MGFLSGAGQGFARGVNDMFANYNAGAELSLQRAQEQRAKEELARQAQIQAIQMQQAQRDLQQEAAYKQELGLLGDKPTVDQLFAIQRKYDPKNAINNQLNYTKNEEANKIKMEQFEQNMKHQIEMLNMKNDAASQLQAQKLQNVLDAIRLKASTPNVNINTGGGKDTEFDKIYNSYVEQYNSEYKQGLHPNKPNPMARWEFKKYLDKKYSGIPDIPIVPSNPTNKIPTWNPKTKKFE